MYISEHFSQFLNAVLLYQVLRELELGGVFLWRYVDAVGEGLLGNLTLEGRNGLQEWLVLYTAKEVSVDYAALSGEGAVCPGMGGGAGPQQGAVMVEMILASVVERDKTFRFRREPTSFPENLLKARRRRVRGGGERHTSFPCRR